MRLKRAKAARKTLRFFQLNGGLAPPYKILIDGTFLVACVRNKVELQERIKRVVQEKPFRMYTIESALEELKSLSEKAKELKKDDTIFTQALLLGKKHCDLLEVDVDSSEDEDTEIGSKLGKTGSTFCSIARTSSTNNNSSKKYFIATQDETLSHQLRKIPCTPILRISRSVLILEAPSSNVKHQAEREENKKLWNAGGTMTKEERTHLQKIKEHERKLKKRKREEDMKSSIRRERDLVGASSEPGMSERTRKKKKAKQPNPLSCKKRKVKGDGKNNTKGNTDTKRNRRRKKNASADA